MIQPVPRCMAACAAWLSVSLVGGHAWAEEPPVSEETTTPATSQTPVSGETRAGEEVSPRLRAFEEQLAAVDYSDFPAMLALADEAIELERLDDADQLYRIILRQDPRHDAAYFSLRNISGSRTLKVDSEPYRDARSLLPDAFKEYRTTRFIMLSDADAKWSREQGFRLERTYDRFVRFANKLDLRPLPLEHRLVAVVFSDLDEFRVFSQGDGTPPGRRIAGYYSPREDRLVFYHVESNENIVAARQQLQDAQAEIDEARRARRVRRSSGRRDADGQNEHKLDEKIRQTEQRRININEVAQRQSISVTVHEAIHQLMFHTRVQSPYVVHPAWLTEGLATVFETDNPRSQFGPSQEFAPRRDGFYQLLDRGQTLPLPELLGLDSIDAGKAVGPVYYQGYALVTWLVRKRPAQFRDYLRRLNTEPPGRPSAARHREIFVEAFGDIARVEKQWRSDEE